MKLGRGVAGLLVVAVLAAGCSHGETVRSEAEVSGGRAVAVTSGNVTLRLPEGASSGSGRLAVSRRGGTAEVPANTSRVGSPVDVELTGATLTGTAKVRFGGVDAGGDPLVVLWQHPGGGWEWLPTTVSGSTVTAETNHFSGGFLGRINVSRWARDRVDALKSYVTARSDVAQPSCGDEQALRDARVAVGSDNGDSVKWCAGVDGGRNVLRVANNRRTYTMVTYPAGWEVLDGGPMGISIDAAIRGGSTWIQQHLATPAGRTVRLLSGGDTLTLAMPPNPSGTVTTEPGTLAWLFSALRFGLETYATVAGAANSELGRSATTAWERLLGEVNAGDPNKGWAAALKGCFESFTDNLTDTPNSATGASVVKYVWKCVPAMMKADLVESGPGLFGLGVLLSAIGTVVGAVLTAAHLVTTGIREIWDGLASFGGNSNPIYDIRIATAAPATFDSPDAVATAFIDAVRRGDRGGAASLSDGPGAGAAYEWFRSGPGGVAPAVSCRTEDRATTCGLIAATPGWNIHVTRGGNGWRVLGPAWNGMFGDAVYGNYDDTDLDRTYCVADPDPLNIRVGAGTDAPVVIAVPTGDCGLRGVSGRTEQARNGKAWRFVDWHGYLGLVHDAGIRPTDTGGSSPAGPLPALSASDAGRATELARNVLGSGADSCTFVKVYGADLANGALDFVAGYDAACGGDAVGTFYVVRSGAVLEQASACGDCEVDATGSTARYRELIDGYRGRPPLDLGPAT
ncbi:MAG: hypothetical protein ACOYOP_14960 [Microthrixaceae bacterium]